MKPYKAVMLIASAAAGLAALLPWVHASVGFASESVNGIDGRGDGKITIVIAALVVVFALAEWFWAAVLPVGLLAAAAAYELIHITGKVNAYNNDSTNVGHVSIGVGVWVLFISAVVVVGALMVALMQRQPTRLREPNKGNERAASAVASTSNEALNDSPSAASIGAPSAEGRRSIASELRKLADLRDDGILTEDEFVSQKARLLSED